MFQSSPVASYQGHNRLTPDEVRFRVRRLRILQDTLARQGISFLFAIAPNKARYQPENLPAHLRNTVRGLTNYELFAREMQAQQVNMLDFVALFKSWKDTTRYALFPKGGTHWSGYGAALAADTLFPRIEQLGHFDLIDFRRQGPVVVKYDSLRSTDADLTETLNLFFPYQSYPAAYPTVVFDSLKTGQQRPNLLIVGDSFNWALMQFWPYLQTLFAPESRFWGMDRNIFRYTDGYTREGHELWQLDFAQEIKSRKFILMHMTEHNLYDHSIIDQMYDLFYPPSEATKHRVQQIEKEMSRPPEMQKRLWEESYQGGHQLADELHKNAVAQYEREQIAEDQRQHKDEK
ncbi:hypothetical protein GCM10028822_40110 [Hymenobacter terrigena]